MPGWLSLGQGKSIETVWHVLQLVSTTVLLGEDLRIPAMGLGLLLDSARRAIGESDGLEGGL